jgi:leader peptidase (prepilin peptidase) / N-methyltransferase
VPNFTRRLLELGSNGAFWWPSPRTLPLAALAIAVMLASLICAPNLIGVLGSGLGLVMLAIAIVDYRRFIIPDQLSVAAFVLGLLHAVVLEPDGPLTAIAVAASRGAVLALIFLGIRVAYQRIRGREGVGLGDVKLAGVAGIWLDWPILPIAVEIAACAALSVYLLRQFVLRRPIESTARLPFGLFFAPAIWIGWVLGTALLTYSQLV